MKLIYIFLFIFCFISYSYSQDIEECYAVAAIKYNVPEVLLRSIANIESGNNSYAINIKGKAVYPKSKEHAKQVIKDNHNKSIDIGLMQINKWWFKRYGYPLELGLDACWNINMGAYILQYEYIRHGGDIWKAVAHYHSPTVKHQNRYIKKIYKEIQAWQKID